MEAIREG